MFGMESNIARRADSRRIDPDFESAGFQLKVSGHPRGESPGLPKKRLFVCVAVGDLGGSYEAAERGNVGVSRGWLHEDR
jgi:hypothetical protein